MFDRDYFMNTTSILNGILDLYLQVQAFEHIQLNLYSLKNLNGRVMDWI